MSNLAQFFGTATKFFQRPAPYMASPTTNTDFTLSQAVVPQNTRLNCLSSLPDGSYVYLLNSTTVRFFNSIGTAITVSIEVEERYG